MDMAKMAVSVLTEI